MPELAHPGWLAMLALLPAAVWLRRASGTAEGRGRRVAGTALRCAAVASLAIALAGPLAASHARRTDVVFALDVSSSVGREPSAQALDLVSRAFAGRAPDARMGLVVFGADAAVESVLGEPDGPVRSITSHVSRAGTDIGRAIEVAVGAFPPGGNRRVVLLSDGRENLGDARAAAAVARSIGVKVYAMALEKTATRHEISVQGVSAPDRVRVHEPFHVQVTVHSRLRAGAHLVVLRDGALLHETRLDLVPGVNVHTLVEQTDRGGLHEYEAIVNSDQDGEPENNRYQAFVQVVGAPKVLHAVGESGLERHVSDALEAQGFTVDEVPASALPASMHRLADYELIILNNVSGFDLSLAKMELLERYVRDAGGGVVMLGGDRSYGAGGYLGTPVENLLPVTMDVRSTVKIPTLAVIFVLDRSGSMASQSQGEEKIDIAKRAALGSIELLNPLDRVGVLAFDDTQEWIVAPTEVGNRAPITEKLRTLASGGSTDLVRALEEAVRVMSLQEAKLRHLIVLSDGLTGIGADFTDVGARIAAEGITMSTVALGLDADRVLMARLAEMGSGRYYHTDDPRNVPRIFTSETMVVARDLVVERETAPQRVYPGEILEGFPAHAFPRLLGYQRAFAKPAAQVLLATDDEDPLLAAWRYGLGKSVAFTSDLSGRWGREWVRWDAFTRFTGQLARWTMRRSGSETLLPEFRWQGRRGEVVVDVLDRDDRFINGLAMQATVSGPERDAYPVRLEQVAPGRYRGEFPVPGAGRYYVNLSGSRGELRVGPRTFGLAVPYSTEFLDLGVDRALLADVAAAAGGRLLPLSVTALPEVLTVDAAAVSERFTLWWPFLLAALVLLVLEVAVRKLAVPRALLEWWAARRGRSAVTDEEPGYEELRLTIERTRNAHLVALRDQGWYDAEDPAVRARLYMPAKRSRSR